MKQFLLLLVISSLLVACQKKKTVFHGTEITIGFEIADEDVELLEKKLNESLKKLKGDHTITSIKVKNMNSYDDIHSAFKNNEAHMLETTYKIYYEALKEDKWNVILHSCYATDFDNDMFYSRGLIIANKSEGLSLESPEEITTVYAVSPYSSTGWFLQHQYLEKEGIKLPEAIYEKSHRRIIERVESTPGSIGICGSFIKPDADKFDILFESAAVPGEVVIVQDSIPVEIVNAVKKDLIEYSVNRFRNDDKQRHFFAVPLRDDYSAYLDYYRPFNRTIIITSITVISLLLIAFFLVRDARNKLKSIRGNGDIIEESKDLFAINQICSIISSYKLENPMSSRMNEKKITEFCKYYKEKKYISAIKILTENLEQTLGILEKKIKSIEHRVTEKHPELENIIVTRARGQQHNTLQAKVNTFTSFCGRLRSLLTDNQKENSPNYGGPFENELAQKLMPYATTGGAIQLLYSYRNFSVHEHSFFLCEEDAITVLRNYLHVYLKICESRLFASEENL